MNLYISDLHFGHTNAITFDNRPFSDTDEMDRCMINLWNNRVSKDDDVYIAGDFSYKSEHTPSWYLKQLKGRKHLILGNHDGEIIQSQDAMNYFEDVDKMMHVSDDGKQICLCHFPIAEWNKSRHGSWLIYGHIHRKKDEVYEFMKSRQRALNAAACINNYAPVSFSELLRNNEAFWMEVKNTFKG